MARLILPAANLAISKTRELFSGEPSMTLKVCHGGLVFVFNLIADCSSHSSLINISVFPDQVAPFLLLGAEYGHLITLRRLCAIG